MAHPHPSRRHTMVAYRRYLLGEKCKAVKRTGKRESFRRGARSLIHYRDYLLEYLEAKRDCCNV